MNNIGSMCSPPKLLNGLSLDSAWVSIKQSYNDNFSNFEDNKINVFCFIGEYHNMVEEILCNSKVYHEINGKLKNYYIFLSPHTYPDNLKIEYKDYFTVIEEPLLYSYYTDKFVNNIDINKNKKLHFLSLNNRASPNRQSLFYFFNKFSLLDKAYFSYLGELYRAPFKSYKEIYNICAGENIPWYLNNLDIDTLNEKIPLKIAGDQFLKNDWSFSQDFYYTDTFCSIVMETYCAEKYPFLTEKTFKPIAFFHPFILNSNKGGLKLLQELGFKTFHDFWDESYDEYNGNRRLEAMFHLILEIGNWSTEKISQMYTDMLPILEHNHNHFFNELPQMFETRKLSLFDQIKKIAEDKKGLLK